MRSFIPFGNPWQMPIATPYSFLVRDGEFAWTCGQIPVNMASKVLAPGDLEKQTNIVCDYIETILRRSGLSNRSLGKLVLYYVEQDAGDMEKMIACCRAHFGKRPVLVPVAVPHFYFDGMLLEVDAFAGEVNDRYFETSSGRSNIRFCDGGEISWICAKTAPDELTQMKILLEEVLAKFGIAADQRLCEHWVAPKAISGSDDLPEIAKNLRRQDLITDEGTLVESAGTQGALMGEITYVNQPDSSTIVHSFDANGVRVVKRKSGRFCWISIRSTDAKLSIVMQTRQIMSALEDALRDEGLDFEAIVKSTSYYTGGNTDDELYENMTIRNNRYSIPGPASTGLPVAGFANNESLIVVDVIALSHLPDTPYSENSRST